ncbi:MAG: hypothetical protein Q9196_006973 [Gyalolechia fulgens]
MEKSSKRISSILSLGSSSSDRSSNASSAFSSHLSYSSPHSNKPLPAIAKRPLKISASANDLYQDQSIQATPTFGPTLSPPLSGDDCYPPNAIPTRAGSRPNSRPASPSNDPLRPLTPGSDADRPDNRASSRRGSPSDSHKDFHPPFTPGSDISRPGSGGTLGPGGRPAIPSKQLPMSSKEKRISRRSSWIPGRSRVEEEADGEQLPQAWVLSPSSADKLPYDLSPLVNFQQVRELWDESGDVTVFLHSKDAYRGPSFRVDSSIFAASKKLTLMAYGTHGKVDAGEPAPMTIEDQVQNISLQPPENQSRSGSSIDGASQGSRTISDAFDETPRQDANLYLSLPFHADLADAYSCLGSDDVEQLVAVRNVFAFLTNQSLVATFRTPTIFDVFLKIADFLQRYEFSNLDGSTLGEEVATNFKEYSDTFKIADIRASREKTLEAIILGERMRSWDLYNEGFVHGVGKYDEITKLKSAKYYMITENTAKRLERATLDLNSRLKTVRTRLESFDFPSLFAGIANSTTSTESKTVRFKAWKAAFLAMRKHVMAFYKERYGAWPPSARSKKNEFGESGLNRILLQEVYRDFSDLYDTLVNRAVVTTRTVDMSPTDGPGASKDDVTGPALRRVMDEYDRSSPPVQPPIPFDTPLLPSLEKTRRGFDTLDAKKQKKENSKRLEDDEINQALMQSYNRDCINSTAFLQAFMIFERESARGKSIEEIQDLRNGQWLFMYAVIQSLPLVIIDAPGLQWTKGVEYFLCEVPKGAAPWIPESHSRGWYAITGSTGVVSLPVDIVNHGVDGIYRRSHCWQVANDLAAAREHDSTENLLSPDDGLPSPSDPPHRLSQRNSVHLGLEALPLPTGVSPSGSKSVVTRHDPSKSFEDILGEPNKSKR